MSFMDCIIGQAKKGFISQKDAERLNAMYESLFKRYSESLGDGAAAHAAAESMVRVQEKIILQEIENDVAFVKGLKKIRADITATK